MNEFERLFALSGLSLDRLRTFLLVAEAGNLARAAQSDPNRQSQYSRQVKELEGFFGVALTRKIGRRIEITAEGLALAAMIRRHFTDLDHFRESVTGRPVSFRLGAPASVLEWWVIPNLTRWRQLLGGAVIEMEQLRSAEVSRQIGDGRLDLGIVRDDAVPKGTRRWNLGRIGYALFAPKTAWKKGKDLGGVITSHPMGGLIPGGQFHQRTVEWMSQMGWQPEVVARVGSFLQLARLVRDGGLAAILPQTAAVDFNESLFPCKPLPWVAERPMVLLANVRATERMGLSSKDLSALAKVLARQGDP
jgi:DNA-binding transcriptional LysR family regulator